MSRILICCLRHICVPYSQRVLEVTTVLVLTPQYQFVISLAEPTQFYTHSTPYT